MPAAQDPAPALGIEPGPLAPAPGAPEPEPGAPPSPVQAARASPARMPPASESPWRRKPPCRGCGCSTIDAEPTATQLGSTILAISVGPDVSARTGCGLVEAGAGANGSVHSTARRRRRRRAHATQRACPLHGALARRMLIEVSACSVGGGGGGGGRARGSRPSRAPEAFARLRACS